MNSNSAFAMINFLKLCYDVFILENKIDALVLKKIGSFFVISHWKFRSFVSIWRGFPSRGRYPLVEFLLKK
jgi:hypothetical protein